MRNYGRLPEDVRNKSEEMMKMKVKKVSKIKKNSNYIRLAGSLIVKRTPEPSGRLAT